jgi:hypothetical protein
LKCCESENGKLFFLSQSSGSWSWCDNNVSEVYASSTSSSKDHWIFGILPQHYTVSGPRRPRLETSPLWKPKNSYSFCAGIWVRLLTLVVESMVQHHSYQISLLDMILSQFHTPPILTNYFPKIHLHVTLLSPSWSPKWLPHQTSACIYFPILIICPLYCSLQGFTTQKY